MNVEFKPDWKLRSRTFGGNCRLSVERNVSYPDRIEGMALTYKYLNNKIVLMSLNGL